MKILNAYAENIIRRNIDLSGKIIEFKRADKNKYKEDTDVLEITAIQKCIYHTALDYSQLNLEHSDAGRTVKEKKELLLTNFNDNIKMGDYCNIGDKLYIVYDILDFDQERKFVDISIEEVKHELN